MAKCLECGSGMKSRIKRMKFKSSPTITVQKVKIEHCTRCGFECLPEKEAIRIQRLINEIRKSIKVPNVKNVTLI